MSDKHLKAFERSELEPGESVLASLPAAGGPGTKPGAAILTDRRICFYRKSLYGSFSSCSSVTGDTLRYQPANGDQLTARFENDAGATSFSVAHGADEAALGALLGKLRDLRAAQADLQEAGYVGGAGASGVSPEYSLVRLKELADMGLLGELEYRLQRREMIAAACGGD